MKTTQDMTKGHPLPLILRFSAPILLASILQQLHSLADGVIAGRFLGMNAFAAISAAGFIAWLPQNMLLGLTHGFGVVLSQLFGAGDEEAFRRGKIRAAMLSGGFALVFMVLLITCCQELLVLLQFPLELRRDSRIYLLVIYGGLIFYALFNWVASVLRAMGDSRTPFAAMLVASVINVALDYVFIKYTPLGVAGPALSTVIAQVISFIICVLAMMLQKVDFPANSHEPVDGSVAHLLYMGLMPMVRDGVIAVGGLFVQRVVNGFGLTVVAGMAAANRYFAIISMSGGCFEGAVGTFSGQNYGAGKYDRIRQGVRHTLALSMGLAAATMILTWLAAPQLIRFITGPEEADVCAMGVYALRWSIAFLPALHLLFIFRPAIQGMGSSVTPMLSGFAELAMRLLCVLCLAECMGYTAACIADGLGWVLASVLLAVRYLVKLHSGMQARAEGYLSADVPLSEKSGG